MPSEEGGPLSCQLWPANHPDVKALLRVVDRARQRFGIRWVCLVADRGMISAATIGELEKQGLHSIPHRRMQSDREVRQELLGRAGCFEDVADDLQAKEISLEGCSYVLCRNPDEARKDAADRAAIVATLEDRLRKATRTLFGNRRVRRFLRRVPKGTLAADRRKLEVDARLDGKSPLRTKSDSPGAEVTLQYKLLLRVQRCFGVPKSLLDSRPTPPRPTL